MCAGARNLYGRDSDSGGPSVDRIIASRGAKWLQQHPSQMKLFRIAKLVDPDCHSLMAGFGLSEISPEQAVPPRQVEAEVAVVSLTVIEWCTRCMSGVTAAGAATRLFPQESENSRD